MRRNVFVCALAAFGAVAASCAAPPPVADPGRSALWGTVRLVPRDDLPAGHGLGGPSSYGDRRTADAELVDYSRPGFVVVYVEGGARAEAPLVLVLRDALGGVRLEPERAAVARGSTLRVENRGATPHVVSSPGAGLVQRLAPGEALRIEVARAGELAVFVADVPDAAARIFAAPGRHAVADGSGRYELVDLPPGPHRVHVWHPRFPPRAVVVELAPGEARRLDLDLGVGLADVEADRGE